MKTKIKKQLTQTIAVAAAAVCAVTATFAGVNYQAAPMDVFALEAGAELSLTQDATNANVFYLDCSTITADEVGDTIKITLESSPSFGGWGCNGCVGYSSASSPTGWEQSNWNVQADANGTIEVETTITEEMVNKSEVQVQCWTPGGENITAYYAEYVASEEDTTTTTTETTTTTTETTTTTTETTTTAPDTTESSETTTTESDVTESSETTTITTTTEPDTTESSETTSTTEKTESSASETTTTTKETTATTTTTTATTTTPKATTTTTTTAPNYDKVITAFTKQSEKGEDGKIYPFIEVEHNNAKSITLVYKVLTDDTNTSGAIGTGGANWSQESWNELAVPTDKLVVIDYVVPSTATETLKISVYWPGVSGVEFKSVTLHYDSDPDVTTTEFESDLTFETVTVHEKDTHKIDMLDRCYIIETIKADPGYTISGGMYSGTEKDTYYTSDSWKETVGESQIIVKEYDIRGAYDASYGIFYYGKDNEKRTSVEVNIQTFYTGDASMNGKVNGSDVRAIVNYIVSGEETNAQNVICDYDYDGEVKLTDAVALTKALLSPAKTKALVS